jgi:hypothetical protein
MSPAARLARWPTLIGEVVLELERGVPFSSTAIIPSPRRPRSSPVPDPGTTEPAVEAPSVETVPQCWRTDVPDGPWKPAPIFVGVIGKGAGHSRSWPGS